MEKKNNSGILVGILIGLVIAVIAGVGLFATGTVGFKTNTTNNNVQTNKDSKITTDDSSSKQAKEINQNTFENLIDEELYILFGFKSLNELTNWRKLTLVFNKLDETYAHSENDVYSVVENVSKKKVEEVFNNTVFSNLGITHQSFDTYDTNDTFYYRKNQYMQKRNLFYCGYEHKVDNFEKKDNKYIMSVKYMFTDTCEGYLYYYGSYSADDQNESNKITNATDDGINYIDGKKYFNENYENIKNKLDTYTYTFEVNGNKINIIDFKVN